MLGVRLADGLELTGPAPAASRLARDGLLDPAGLAGGIARLTLDGRQVVTWERGGLTCILSGDIVDRSTLLKLAAWQGKGDVPF